MHFPFPHTTIYPVIPSRLFIYFFLCLYCKSRRREFAQSNLDSNFHGVRRETDEWIFRPAAFLRHRSYPSSFHLFHFRFFEFSHISGVGKLGSSPIFPLTVTGEWMRQCLLSRCPPDRERRREGKKKRRFYARRQNAKKSLWVFKSSLRKSFKSMVVRRFIINCLAKWLRYCMYAIGDFNGIDRLVFSSRDFFFWFSPHILGKPPVWQVRRIRISTKARTRGETPACSVPSSAAEAERMKILPEKARDSFFLNKLRSFPRHENKTRVCLPFRERGMALSLYGAKKKKVKRGPFCHPPTPHMWGKPRRIFFRRKSSGQSFSASQTNEWTWDVVVARAYCYFFLPHFQRAGFAKNR